MLGNYSKLLEKLQSGSPPFILTVMFAAIAWWFSYTVDRITSEKTLEYRTTTMALSCPESLQPPCFQVTLELENLSDAQFRNMKLELLFPQGSTATFYGENKLVVSPPNWGPTEEIVAANNSLPIRFAQFQPGARASIVAQYHNKSDPILFIRDSDGPIKLVKPSLETNFVRYQSNIIFAGILAFVCFAFAVITNAVSIAVFIFITVVFVRSCMF